MLRHMVIGVVISVLNSLSLSAMASDRSPQVISTLYELSKQVITDHERDLLFEQQLPVARIPNENLKFEWLRDVALRNMFHNYGLESDPQRMRELVAGQVKRLYSYKAIKNQTLPAGYQNLAGHEYAAQCPIDLINPGSNMTQEHQHFMEQLYAQGFRFNTYAGKKLVLRAVKNNNIDFVYYALRRRFNVCAYQEEVEKSLPYKLLKDYCEDILLPFLTTHPGQKACKEFVPIIRLLIKAGAKVKQLHIDQAIQAHDSELERLFVHYFKKEQSNCRLSDANNVLVPSNGLLFPFACKEPFFNPAALSYLKQEQ